MMLAIVSEVFCSLATFIRTEIREWQRAIGWGLAMIDVARGTWKHSR